MLTHDADWFREQQDGGAHNALPGVTEPGADIADMVSATTCLPDDFVKVRRCRLTSV